MKERSVPFDLRPAAEQRVAKIEKVGVISPVENTKFATPLVPVANIMAQ